MTSPTQPVPVTGAGHPLRRVRSHRGLTQIELAGLPSLHPPSMARHRCTSIFGSMTLPARVSEWDRVAVAAVAGVPVGARWVRAGPVRAGGYRPGRGS